jgi:hypothetical protein
VFLGRTPEMATIDDGGGDFDQRGRGGNRRSGRAIRLGPGSAELVGAARAAGAHAHRSGWNEASSDRDINAVQCGARRDVRTKTDTAFGTSRACEHLANGVNRSRDRSRRGGELLAAEEEDRNCPRSRTRRRSRAVDTSAAATASSASVLTKPRMPRPTSGVTPVNDEHRALGAMRDRLGHRPERLQSVEATAANDEDVGVPACVDEGLNRMAVDRLGAEGSGALPPTRLPPSAVTSDSETAKRLAR